jgi:hypothetical protein
MATVMRTVMPLLFDHRARALAALVAALAAGVLLGPSEAAALPRVH